VDYYFEQVLPDAQHAPFGQSQLSPQQAAQSLQQQESDLAVADVFVAKNKPAAPIISAAAAINMFFLIVVFLKVLKNGFVLYGLCIIYLCSPRSKGIRQSSAVRTHHVELGIRLTT